MPEMTDSTLFTVQLLITMKRFSIIDYDKIMFEFTPFYGRDSGKLVVEWI